MRSAGEARPPPVPSLAPCVADTVRLDKFLWFARIVKTRAHAQEMAERGRIRLNSRPVDKAHVPVRIGDVLSFARHGRCAFSGSRRCPRGAARRPRRGPSIPN